MSTLVVYDSTDKSLSHIWASGAAFYKALGWCDAFEPVEDWTDVWASMIAHNPTEAHIWGHAMPGAPLIGGERMGSLVALSKDVETIWFRSCAVFCGNPGREFAMDLARFSGCVIAGHTHNIGRMGLQSGLYTIGPEEMPQWLATDGNAGTPDNPIPKWSMPWSPRTITALTHEIPRGW